MNIGGVNRTSQTWAERYMKDPQTGSQRQNDASKKLREKIRGMQKSAEPTETKRDPKKPIVFQGNSESVISQSQKYTQSLKMDRVNSKKTSQAVKKLKYSFKSVSSKILQSKTSASAKQVVGQAKREVTRLKRALASGEYDKDEVAEALAHAKIVERIARKKAKHLEQEEIATAASKAKEQDEKNETSATGEVLAAEASKADEELQELAELSEEYVEHMPSEDMMAELDELTSEMMLDMFEAYDEMLEELGFEDISESVLAASGEMSPEDIKMMKAEHRSKEVRDLMKADMEYLKAMFDHLEKQQQSSAPVSAAVPNAMPVGGVSIQTPQEALASIMPSIDLSI